MQNNPPSTQPSRNLRWRLFPAVAIIAIGVVFLLNNLGYPLAFLARGNWWAVFIVCAAIAPLSRAYEVYRERGHFDAEAAYCTLCGAAMLLVAAMFLANLDWGVWWPLFVILGGFYTLVRRPYRCSRHSWRYRWHDDDAPTNH